MNLKDKFNKNKVDWYIKTPTPDIFWKCVDRLIELGWKPFGKHSREELVAFDYIYLPFYTNENNDYSIHPRINIYGKVELTIEELFKEDNSDIREYFVADLTFNKGYIFKAVDYTLKYDICILPSTKEIFKWNNNGNSKINWINKRKATPEEIEHYEQCVKASKYVDYVKPNSDLVNIVYKRLALPEEVEWLNTCIKANKFIPKNEVMKEDKPIKIPFDKNNWVIRQNTSEKVCRLFNELSGFNSFVGGGYYYIGCLDGDYNMYNQVINLTEIAEYQFLEMFNKKEEVKEELPFKIGDKVVIMSKPLQWSSNLNINYGLDKVKYPYIFTVKNIKKIDNDGNTHVSIDGGDYGWSYSPVLFKLVEEEIPEYVKCVVRLNNAEVGKIYPVINKTECKCERGSIYNWKSYEFISSNKEAYDNQFKEESMKESNWVPKVGEYAVMEKAGGWGYSSDDNGCVAIIENVEWDNYENTYRIDGNILNPKSDNKIYYSFIDIPIYTKEYGIICRLATSYEVQLAKGDKCVSDLKQPVEVKKEKIKTDWKIGDMFEIIKNNSYGSKFQKGIIYIIERVDLKDSSVRADDGTGNFWWIGIDMIKEPIKKEFYTDGKIVFEVNPVDAIEYENKSKKLDLHFKNKGNFYEKMEIRVNKTSKNKVKLNFKN